MNFKIPDIQKAVQLVGPDELLLNEEKKINAPGDYQILAEVEAVGLCFSDLKLLKQFSSHARKSKILSGIDESILEDIPSYVPDELPTVPGHEAVVTVVQVGKKVKDINPGQRFLVQTDYRWLPTANSNGSFGYNFEGALQQYVLMDERVITSPDGNSMLIPASEELSASSIALVEPWACVENAYSVTERSTLKEDGRMLVVADNEFNLDNFKAFISRFGKPAEITLVSKIDGFVGNEIPVRIVNDISSLDDASFDDVIYFGSKPETVEMLFPKIAAGGLFNITLCGGRLDRNILIHIGRIHYGNIRVTGTTGSNPADSMEHIPSSGEIRKGDKINVIGAGGPMGVMHVVRNLCQGVEGVTVYGGDLDDERLGLLEKIAAPLANKNNVSFNPYNPSKFEQKIQADYSVITAPVPKLVDIAVETSAEKGIINIFAGIPATVEAEINLDSYIEKRLYFIGTSGSTLEDMKTVLKKVEADLLDTNISVGAICGIDHAVEGIRTVESQTIAGKIIVYPACESLRLTELKDVKEAAPGIENCLKDGLWNKEAENILLKSKID